MPKYNVTVTQYHTYEVEAENEDDAYTLGLSEFVNAMCYPVADTHYDEVDVEELDEE